MYTVGLCLQHWLFSINLVAKLAFFVHYALGNAMDHIINVWMVVCNKIHKMLAKLILIITFVNGNFFVLLFNDYTTYGHSNQWRVTHFCTKNHWITYPHSCMLKNDLHVSLLRLGLTNNQTGNNRWFRIYETNKLYIYIMRIKTVVRYVKIKTIYADGSLDESSLKDTWNDNVILNNI